MLVSGMIIGTLFTLFVVPSIYMLLARTRVAEPAAAQDDLRIPGGAEPGAVDVDVVHREATASPVAHWTVVNSEQPTPKVLPRANRLAWSWLLEVGH